METTAAAFGTGASLRTENEEEPREKVQLLSLVDWARRTPNSASPTTSTKVLGPSVRSVKYFTNAAGNEGVSG